jgi:hypothetical protein
MSNVSSPTRLLIVSAAAEAGAGLALLVCPAVIAGVLFGGLSDAPEALLVARIAGVALLALAVACWLARNDGANRAGRAVIAAMLVYNSGATAVLALASIGQGMSGPGLWPAVVLHACLATWCVSCLRAEYSDHRDKSLAGSKNE